ncbi:MAG: hypothetical protein EOP51_32920 [Sphingobacteriales bacterium]|nr:MAG: hypothetical protein EOP51_32920 [Sphingobacteriales bacterium]
MPIAKIENIAYASIPSTALSDAVTASNTQTESQLLIKLEALRNNPALTYAMMSSYTFIPGIGVSKMVQPNGNTVTYTYDSLGRLITAKDHNGNLLSANEYHYKP